MNDKKKIKLILIIAFAFILTVLGITYAFFNYSRTGENNKLIAGEVYLRYIETNQMTLNNAIPETKTSALQKNDNIFYFKIEGKNTSTNDIFYDIIISHGDSQSGKSRLEDSHIRIYLERDGVTLIDGEIFDDWDNPVIYTDKMPALTNSHTVFNYELRMWVDEDVTISDTDPTADYDTATWNNSYASLKLHVNSGGVFENAQPASCFTYDVITEAKTVEYAKPIITYNFSDENVAKCQQFMMNNSSDDYSDAQDGYQSFCQGIGTSDGFVLEDLLVSGILGDSNEIIPELGVIESYKIQEKYYELNTSDEAVNSCSSIMMMINRQDVSDEQDGYQRFCQGTGVIDGSDIFVFVSNFSDVNPIALALKNRFFSSNVFTPVTEVSEEIRILGYGSCGPDVSIPSYIDGLPVTTIGYMDESEISGETYAFSHMNINTVKFPSTLKYIGVKAFSHCGNLTDVTIPSNVISIGDNAFEYTSLVNVDIQGSPSLGSSSFYIIDTSDLLTFSYGGTCNALNSYGSIIFWNIPQTIITTDSNNCLIDVPES